jgi:small nuclear ribonucleoprotein (snRNP)-like protein
LRRIENKLEEKMKSLVGKKVVVYTKKGFRFGGDVQDFDGKFLDIFDEVRKKSKMINIDEIVEIEKD